jgi:acyl dehydratase
MDVHGEWDSMALAGVARHLDSDLARVDGLPAAFDVGGQRAAWLGQLLTDWMGDHGELVEVSCRFGRMIFVGDTPTCKAVVTCKRQEEGRHLVELDLSVSTQNGAVASVGTGLVALPRRS